MIHRIIQSTLVAIPLALIGCGGAETTPDDTAAEETAGLEETPEQELTEAEREAREQALQQQVEAEPQPTTPTEPPAELGPVSDDEVDAFVDVLFELALIEQEGIARLAAGEDPSTVEAELTPRLDGIFDDKSITAERFREIAEAADEDDVLIARIEDQIDDRLPADDQLPEGAAPADAEASAERGVSIT